MRAKLEALREYAVMMQTFYFIALMKAIKGLPYQFEGQRYHAHSLHQTKKRFYSLHQGKDITNAKFLETFQSLVSVIEQCVGVVGYDPGVIMANIIGSGLTLETETQKKIAEATKLGCDKYVAMLRASDTSRYGKLCEDLENDSTKGHNNFPVSVTEVYNLIVDHKQKRPIERLFNDSEGVAFATVAKSHTPMIDQKGIKCYSCQNMGTTQMSAQTRNMKWWGGHVNFTSNDGS
jgi:hypothetical protein